MLEFESIELNSDSEKVPDDDTCDVTELNRIFSPAFHKSRTLIDPKKYVLHINATLEANPKVVAALSDFSCVVYDFNNDLHKMTTIDGHTDKVIDCIFSHDNPSLIYTGSSDGTIKLWDLRGLKDPAVEFTDDSVKNKNKKKEYSCFDVSSNNRLLTVGTNLSEGDAFILFWDIRKTDLLGGYWESHTDDITQVKFHSSDSNKLISGSTDGLINVYDLKQPCEEDALTDTLNTLCSIDELVWFEDSNNDNIGCITTTNELQLWDVGGVEPYTHFRRIDFCKEIKRSKEDYIYLAKSCKTKNGLLVLTGSNSNEGECLRSLHFLKSECRPAVSFIQNQQIVRASWYNEHNGFLITGGEKGILDIWKINLDGTDFKVNKKK